MVKKQIAVLFLVPLLLIAASCAAEEPDISASTPPPLSTPHPTPTFEPAPTPECVHFWSNPDCFNSPYCLDCGEISGSPLPHEWSAANYQQPSECINCGEVDGAPLEPNFISYGYQINATSGRPHKYKTITDLDTSLITYGTATLLYTDIFESGDGYRAKSGYEYILVRFMIIFDDENAVANGYRYMTGQVDFYCMDPDEIPVPYENLRDSDIPGFRIAYRTINYYGEDYEYYLKYELIQNEWIGDIAYVLREHVFLVPAGYDGIVLYLSNAGNWMDHGSTLSDNFDNDTLFFRLVTQTR